MKQSYFPVSMYPHKRFKTTQTPIRIKLQLKTNSWPLKFIHTSYLVWLVQGIQAMVSFG